MYRILHFFFFSTFAFSAGIIKLPILCPINIPFYIMMNRFLGKLNCGKFARDIIEIAMKMSESKVKLLHNVSKWV